MRGYFVPETMGADWKPKTPPPAPWKDRKPKGCKLDQFGSDIPDTAPSEWSPPIAAPERKKIELRCGITGENLPTTEWSPTKGKPVDTTHVLPKEPFKIPMPQVKLTLGTRPTICQPTAANSEVPEHSNVPDWWFVENGSVQLDKDCDRLRDAGGRKKYKMLHAILMDAYDHAATGKGKERHARDLPFDEQPMLETTRLVGPGFPLGQAIKKAGEAAGMIERGELGAAEAECLGAINYLAGAVVWMREQRAAPHTEPTSVGAA